MWWGLPSGSAGRDDWAVGVHYGAWAVAAEGPGRERYAGGVVSAVAFLIVPTTAECFVQVHLAYCDSCRTKFEEYQRLHADVIPLMAASASSEPEGPRSKTSGFSLDAAEQRLMAQLDTAPVAQEPRHRRKIPWAVAAGLLAVCALGTTYLLHIQFTPSKRDAVLQPVAPQNSLRASKPMAPTNHETLPPPLLNSLSRTQRNFKSDSMLPKNNTSSRI